VTAGKAGLTRVWKKEVFLSAVRKAACPHPP
jgi:hypothetical protein